jgi:ribonucleoside-diphosphate reductase alpha chain
LLSSRSEVEGAAFGYDSHEHTHTTTPPQQGIAPDLSARSGLDTAVPSFEDRGIYHASDAMKSMYDMGDSPSCATCGAIMTRSGSCYRCMSCGSTSGCS